MRWNRLSICKLWLARVVQGFVRLDFMIHYLFNWLLQTLGWPTQTAIRRVENSSLLRKVNWRVKGILVGAFSLLRAATTTWDAHSFVKWLVISPKVPKLIFLVGRELAQMSAHTTHGLIFTYIIVLPLYLVYLKCEIVVSIYILHIKAAATVACGECLLVRVNFAI